MTPSAPSSRRKRDGVTESRQASIRIDDKSQRSRDSVTPATAQGEAGLTESRPPTPRRRRPATAEQRQAVGRALVLTIRQGALMTRDQAGAWLRDRLPHRAGHPGDADSLLDGLLLSQLAGGPDGILMARSSEPAP